MHSNKEYDILEIIHNNPKSVRQRDLANAADLSLGMTNAVLKKLVTKGFLVMKKVNSRNIQYALTSKGMTELALRSKKLLKKTLENVVRYRIVMENLVINLRNNGYDSIKLSGPCDIDFILEWACIKHGINYNCDGVASLMITKEELYKVINKNFEINERPVTV